MITRTRIEAVKALRQGKSAEQINELVKLLAAKSEQYFAERKRSDALATLLRDRQYIQMKADYNRGHLSHAGSLEERERGLGL